MRLSAAIAVVLFAGVLLLYWPALNGAFLNYDDPAYVTKNAHVLRGLSWENIAWAFSATVEANWHPVTWISHMADVQMFGANPRGPHAVNVLLHAVNVVLLFFVLLRTTKHAVRSGMVAALFAVHPLNVECVAWVAERKSLLAMLFFLLALAAYGWYAERRSAGRYLLVVMAFALGLAAKPMIVTLPILLLLWDYWPLKRIDGDARWSTSRLVAEKIPLLVLSGASAWITIYAQRRGGALGTTELLPHSWRVENAIYSYAAYIGKGIWPSGLAVFYPHPEGALGLWKVLLAAFLIIVASVLVWRDRERHRYLVTGWFWYLIAMLPMIGMVQVGRQAMADRYAYLPFVGLFVIAVWGGADLFASLKLSRGASGAVAAAVIAGYACVSFVQIRYWHDSYALFSHALAVTKHNGVAEDNLGTALMEMGRPDLAMTHFEAAVEYVPQLSTAHYNLGVLEQQQNRLDVARQEYELSLKYATDATEIAQAHGNLGFVWLQLGDLSHAKQEFTAALGIAPDKQNSLVGRGIVEYRQKDLDAAAGDLLRAAQIAPSAQADFWLGRVLEERGQVQQAMSAYQAALQVAPNLTDARRRLDALRGSQGSAGRE